MKSAPHVVLVDDDRIYHFATQKMLTRLHPDVQITWFQDGEQALAYFTEHLGANGALPDVVIVDVNMPYMDGWQFVSAM
jgi:CheY-like chemotaxis protein